jgi:sterol desaturase/sphingolipid hydroxylase (fatty acid hydroxylase superfamily)
VLLAAYALLWSVEAFIPLFRYQPGRWRRALPNLALAVGVMAVNLAMASATASLSSAVRREHIGLLAGLGSHPWLLVALGIAGLDLFAYFAHRLLHKIPLGWRFHRVHHSDAEVDVTTALRQHPGETLWRLLWQLLGIVAFGLPFWIAVLYSGLSSLNALLEHANLKMNGRLDACLRWVIVTPNMHKIHHSQQMAETDSNYSNIFSIWDRLGRTYTTRKSCQDLRYGLGEEDDRKSTLGGLLRMPF